MLASRPLGLAVFVLSLLQLLVLTPLAAQTDEATLLLRMPTVSDSHVAFVYANDLWLVERAAAEDASGADALRLTSAPGSETNPRFSPDGEWIAFTGQYGGQQDVYVVPVRGGEPRRLTFHRGADLVQGWTPEGDAVDFRSGREGHPTEGYSSNCCTVQLV